MAGEEGFRVKAQLHPDYADDLRVRDFIEQLGAIVGALDPERVRPQSGAEVVVDGHGVRVRLEVIPHEPRLTPLTSIEHLHTFMPGEDAFPGLRVILEEAKDYFAGATLVEHFNRDGRLVRREWYVGIGTQDRQERRTATEEHPETSPPEVAHSRATMFQFAKRIPATPNNSLEPTRTAGENGGGAS